MKVIDLFAGCGGLSLGFKQNGHDIIKAIEYDKNIAVSYKENHPEVNLIVDDIRNVDIIKEFKYKQTDVIIGGPPCQGFSMAGSRIRNGFIDDDRNYLFKYYFNIVKRVKPKIFIMENVKGIITMQKGKIFEEIVNIFSDKSMLDEDSYSVSYKVVKATEFGIPQKRERVIIIGVLNRDVEIDLIWDETIKNIKEEIPSFFDRVTIKDAILDLGKTTKNGKVYRKNIIDNNYLSYLSNGINEIENHIKSNHSEIAINRMSKIKCGENYMVLDEDIKSVHSGSYGRLCWEDQSPTITTRFDTPTGGRFIHPIYNRTLSPREAARIQSFPDDFKFYGTKTSICKQIGNAVPPKISYFLSKLVENIIKEKDNFLD